MRSPAPLNGRQGPRLHWLLSAALAGACCWPPTPAAAQSNGGSEAGRGGGALRIGVSAPLTGPQAPLGQGLVQGLKAAFLRLNNQGGVEGRAVELLVLDDAGQAARTLSNTRELLAQEVVALTGYQGAAGVEAVMDLLDSAGVPLVGAASSAESLRDPPRRWLFNLRAGAVEETAAIIQQLDTMGINQVAVLSQADGLGRGVQFGVETELTRVATRPAAMETLPAQAGQAAVEAGLKKVCATRPSAVVLALSARNALAALRSASGTPGCPRNYQVLSETGAELAAQGALSGEQAGLVVSQVLPAPRGNHPLAQDARRDLALLPEPPAPGYPQLEGYLYGRVLAEALRPCGRKAVPACVINTLNQRQLTVSGYALQFTPENRRGARFVELTVVDAQGRLRR